MDKKELIIFFHLPIKSISVILKCFIKIYFLMYY